MFRRLPFCLGGDGERQQSVHTSWNGVVWVLRDCTVPTSFRTSSRVHLSSVGNNQFWIGHISG